MQSHFPSQKPQATPRRAPRFDLDQMLANASTPPCGPAPVQLLELSRLHDRVLRPRRRHADHAAAPQAREDSTTPRYIVTLRGAGYRFGVPVETVY
jgi:hypothetical protein